jgi:hypothetical protein
MVTRPFTFTGRKLALNYATSAVGNVQVEVQSPDGRAVQGFELTSELYGDEIEGIVQWPEGADVSRLEGEAVRLRFVLKDADLYSLRFSA